MKASRLVSLLLIISFNFLCEPVISQRNRAVIFEKLGVSVYYDVVPNALLCGSKRYNKEDLDIYVSTYRVTIKNYNTNKVLVNLDIKSTGAIFTEGVPVHCENIKFPLYGFDKNFYKSLNSGESWVIEEFRLGALSIIPPSLKCYGTISNVHSPIVHSKTSINNSNPSREENINSETSKYESVDRNSFSRSEADDIEMIRIREFQSRAEHDRQLKLLDKEAKIRREESLTTLNIVSDVGFSLHLNGKLYALVKVPPYMIETKVEAGDVGVKVILLADGSTYIDEIFKDLQPQRVKIHSVNAKDKLGQLEEIRYRREIAKIESEEKEIKTENELRYKISRASKYIDYPVRDGKFVRNINEKQKDDLFPLEKATSQGDLDGIIILYELGANSKGIEESLIKYSLRLEKPDVLNYYINTMKLTIKLDCGMMNNIGSFSVYKYSYDNKLFISCSPNSGNLLSMAAAKGDLQWCKLLVEHGYQVNHMSSYPVYNLPANNFYEDDSQSVLFWSMTGRNLEVIEFLLKNGAKSSGKYGINAVIKARLKKLSDFVPIKYVDDEETRDIVKLLKKYKQ
jgi:hypothetical protein